MLEKKNHKAQISLEFLIVYIMVLTVFVMLFGLISSQRALSVNEQQGAYLQLVAQSVASRIDQVVAAGNGYNVTMPISGQINNNPYTLFLTSTGTILINMSGNQGYLNVQSFSDARSFIINGTLQSQSTSQIQLYKIPLYSGVLKLENYHGTIYVDANPPNASQIPSAIYTNLLGSTQVANFNPATANAFINTTYYRNITASGWTESAWVDVKGGPNRDIVLTNRINANNAQSLTLAALFNGGIGASYPNKYNFFFGLDGAGIGQFATTNAVYSYNKWYFLTGVYNNSYGLKLYVDGVPQAYYTNSGSYGPGGTSTTGALSLPPYNSLYNWAIGHDSAWNVFFNGSIANVQMYDAPLSTNQIIGLYQAGIGASPIGVNNFVESWPYSLVAWWPLNGNVNNYGSGGSGTAYNITYSQVNEFNTHALTFNGLGAGNVLIGSIANNGNMSAYGQAYANLTNQNGNATSFAFAPFGASSNWVATTGLLNNISLNSNVILWAPIIANTGNVVYDLSGHYNNGVFNNQSYIPRIGNRTDTIVAGFNGIDSRINANLSSVYSTGATLTAWINNTGPSAIGNGWQNILQINGTPITTQVINIGVDGASGNFVTRWSNDANTILYDFNSKSVQVDNKYFVAGIWNGENNTLSLYVNGKYAGFAYGNGTIDTILNSIDIGGGYSGMGYFNGSIENAQAYNATLNAAQIETLYKRGPTGLPLVGERLIGWWPLDGNANDYSYNNLSSNAANIQYQNRYFFGSSRNGYALNISKNPVYAMRTPITTLEYNYTVNSWFMIRSLNGNTPITSNPCCTLMNPIMSIYDGNANGGLGDGQNFNFGSLFAGGKKHSLSWIYDMQLGGASINCTSANNTIFPGVWYNAIVSVRKYSNITIYINGNQAANCVSQISVPVSTLTATLMTSIGTMPAASSFYYGNESITDIEILNKSVNKNDAVSIYRSGMPSASYVNITT